jgi:glucose/arabinose dehydrogenase/plastocyanin
MKRFSVLLILLLVTGVCAAIAGCTTSSPLVTITSPQNGATITGGDVQVNAQVSNFRVVDKQGQASVAGEGHLHFYMDVTPVPSDPTKPAIPADAKAVWAHVSGTSYKFTNVPAGTHTFTVQIVNNDHTPVSPLVTASVTVTVKSSNDLTNKESPEAATFTVYPSATRLNKPDMPIGLRFIAGGFTAPITIADPHDGSGRLFMVDQSGYVKIFFLNGTVIDKPFLDVRDRLVRIDPTYDERGLLSIAFHPQFASNGRVFAYYSAPLRAGVDPNWSCTNHLSEFRVSASDRNQVDMSTEKVLLQVDKPYQNHNGGTLLFGPADGYLYLPLGDGGRADDTGMGHTPGIGNAQDLTKILGKVIRIDVDHTSPGKQYAIPADNPFLSNTSIVPEIYAYGFRNPAYATFDSGGSHRMFIAMAGQRLFESVLIVYKGGNYPWNIREGTHCFNPSNDFLPPAGSCPTTGYSGQQLIGPVVELGHDVGDTVVGGVVYRGSLMPSLQGSYLYGTWSDENRIVGNGTLLLSKPPADLDLSTLPEDASDLTPARNAMWSTWKMSVANNANGRINAFIRGLYEDNNHEVLVLINQNGGPGLTPQGSGQIWQMVPATTPGLVSTTTPLTPTPTATMPMAGGSAVAIRLTIKGDKFNPTNLTVPTGSRVTLTYDDQDLDPHNFALYPSTSTSNAIFRSPVIAGPVTETYVFTAPATPGTYYFRSDPNTGLLGILTVTSSTVPATPASQTTSPLAGGTTRAITLTAKNIAFDTNMITVPAGSTVVMTFVNNDVNIPHNFALYTDSTATGRIFVGDIVTGVKTVTYTFTAPSKPGNYFFRCDVHPEAMTGTFVVT